MDVKTGCNVRIGSNSTILPDVTIGDNAVIGAGSVVTKDVPDNIILAEIPINTPRRFKIIKCNEYMVDKSDYLIAYVAYSFGGAAKTLEYAKRKKKKIFNLCE